jgi:hypothetical protein
MLVYILFMSMVVAVTWATYGVDVSQGASVAAFQCLKGKVKSGGIYTCSIFIKNPPYFYPFVCR